MADEFDDYSSDKYGRVGDSRPPEIDREAKKARKAYERLLDRDDLLETTDREARFLAKMYVCAEHFGVLDKYKQLIEDAMKVRPDKVKSVAKVFDAVSLIYDTAGKHAEDYRDNLEREGHLTGKAADAYYAEFDTLNNHLFRGKHDLSEISANTADLLDKFGDALVAWRKGIADAIKAMSEQERDREWAATKGFFLGLITKDPFEAARETLDSLLELWYKTEQDAKASDSTLKSFADDRGFNMEDAKYDDVHRSDVVLTDPWNGSFK